MTPDDQMSAFFPSYFCSARMTSGAWHTSNHSVRQEELAAEVERKEKYLPMQGLQVVTKQAHHVCGSADS